MFKWLKLRNTSEIPVKSSSPSTPPPQEPVTPFVQGLLNAAERTKREQADLIRRQEIATENATIAYKNRQQQRLRDVYAKSLEHMSKPEVLKSLQETISFNAKAKPDCRSWDFTEIFEEILTRAGCYTPTDNEEQEKAIEATLLAITGHFKALGVTFKAGQHKYSFRYTYTSGSYDTEHIGYDTRYRPGIKVSW